jgi:ketosteroid isomerase-like protein
VDKPSRIERSEAVTRRLFEAYEAKDYDALMEIYSKDAVIELPFNSSGKTEDNDIRRIKGEAELKAFLVPGLARYRSIRYDIEDMSITNSASRVFVEARGDFITADGKPYRNRYVFRLDLRGESVIRQKEYFNVATVKSVFAT